MALHAQSESPPFEYAYGYGMPDYSQQMFVQEGVNDMMFVPQSLGIATPVTPVIESPDAALQIPMTSQMMVPDAQEQERQRILKLEETVARLQQENQEMQVKLVHQQQEPIMLSDSSISPVATPVAMQPPQAQAQAVVAEEYTDASAGNKRRRQTQTKGGNKRRRGKKNQQNSNEAAGQPSDPSVPIPEQPPSTPYGTSPGREPYPSAADVTAMMAKIDEQIEKEDEEMLFAKDEDSDDEFEEPHKNCNHDHHAPTVTPRNGGRGRKTKGAPVQVDGKFKCQWHDCGLLFDKMEDLVEHLSEGHVGHGKSKYACFWGDCNRYGIAFPKRHKLTTHIRSHTGEQPYMCPIPNCGKIFSRKDSMKTHVKTHTHVRQWHCRIRGCKKSYIHKRSLNKHEELHWKSLVEAWKSLGYVMLPNFNQATLQEAPHDLSQQPPAQTVSPVNVAPTMPILDPQHAASIAAMGLLFPVDPQVATQIQRQKMQSQAQMIPPVTDMVPAQQYPFQMGMENAAAAIPPPPQPPPSAYPAPAREQPQYVWTNEVLETGQSPEHAETKVAREFQFHQHNMY